MCKESLSCLLTEKCTNEESIRADERKNTLNDFRKRLIDEMDNGFSFTMVLVDEIIKEQLKE